MSGEGWLKVEENNYTNQTSFEIELPPEAEPVAWIKLNFNQVNKFRWLLCPNYNICLSYAAGQTWESFICLFCPIWAKEKKGEKYKQSPSAGR